MVAHSIGGIVCENALVRSFNGSPADKQLNNCVRRVALMGTPFHCDYSSWGETGANFMKYSGTSDGSSLKENLGKSEKLVEINRNFKKFIDSRRVPGSFGVACFYESMPTEIEGNTIFIADEETVKIPGCPEPSRLATTHQGMVEVSSPDDPNFKRLLRLLRSWIDELEIVTAEVVGAKTEFNSTYGDFKGSVQLTQNTGHIQNFWFLS
ncbi:Fc.00g072140.m01.CDS01 [Cosmosporella sp. VM-42]